MSTIYDLKTGILEMPFDSALELIMQVRASRRTSKRVLKYRKSNKKKLGITTTRQKAAPKQIALTAEQGIALLALFDEMEKEL